VFVFVFCILHLPTVVKVNGFCICVLEDTTTTPTMSTTTSCRSHPLLR